ncbi:MAG: class I adenylate-forming enzyme family protein [Gammaproteobacteria bacterium]|nr:class I adenylate-forming enzyme family protein [Gammaproteobacteria bacterium]
MAPGTLFNKSEVNMSLSGLLIQQERKDPERTYIGGYFGRVTYGETLMLARQLAQLLALSSHIAGRRSVGISTESPEYLAYTVWATIFADISIVFLPRCQNPEMMRRSMKEASVEVLLTDEPALLQESWCLDLKDMLRRALSGDNQPGASAKALPTAPCESDAGFIFQTSGTAGEPKWVQCEYRKFSTVINCMLHNGVLEHARGQSVFLTPPLYHSYGLSAFLEYTAVGAMIIFPQGTSPLGPVGDLRDPALRGNVTAIEGVPYFYTQLSKLAGRFIMPGLNHLGLGGGRLDNIAFDKLREVYPDITVSVRYGMTETPSVVSHRVIRSFSREDWKSSGPVLPVYNVEIVDGSGRILERNQTGEIIVSGDCVGTYLGLSGNRLLTGDTGYITSNNELVINGRKSLYIKNRGFRVSPEQVESVIASFNGVQDCRVLMVDFKLVAEVVYDDCISQGDILTFMSTRLPSYAIVDEVVRVESVPRTPSGKIRRYH